MMDFCGDDDDYSDGSSICADGDGYSFYDVGSDRTDDVDQDGGC